MIRLLLGYIFVSSIIAAGCTDSANQKNLDPRTITPQPASENRIPGQYLVTLKEGGSPEKLTEVFNKYEIKSIQELSTGRYLITLDQDPGPQEVSKQAATSSNIEHVQPNYFYQTMPSTQQKQLLER
jgi:hypothetical protein